MFSCVTVSNRRSFFVDEGDGDSMCYEDFFVGWIYCCVVFPENRKHLRVVTRVFLTPAVTVNSQALIEKKKPKAISSDFVVSRRVVALFT